MNRLNSIGVFLKKSKNCTTVSTYATFLQKKEKSSIISDSITESKSQPFDGHIVDYIKRSHGFQDIDYFKNELFKKFSRLNKHNFDANFMRVCLAERNLNVGRAYFQHLEENNIAVNTATLSKFIILCYYCRSEVKGKIDAEKLCTTLKSHSKYLDVHTQQSLILGLSMTSNWKEALYWLQEMERNDSVKSLPVNAIISCSLDHRELSIAVSLMETLIQHEKELSDAVLEKWIKLYAENKEVREEFMNFLCRHELFLSKELTRRLKETVENSSTGTIQGCFTTVDNLTGKCQNCQKKLKNYELNDEQFSMLRSALLEKVLHGPDVYIGSNPQELKRFRNFVRDTAPYDVVIDGLNVIYTFKSKSSPSEKMQLLKIVVNHFHQQKKKVLVLGRNHMRKWNRSVIRDIENIGHLFTTENTSRDDPFMLYATLHSGKKAQFLSEDIMRDHLFRLGDHDLRTFFRRWQRSSQLQIKRINFDGSITIQKPPKHSTITQFSDHHWHIPYDDGELRYSYQLPNTWLCLKPISPTT